MKNRRVNILWVIALVTCLSTNLIGQTWTTLQGPPKARDEKDVAVSSAGTTLYAADKSVLFKSTNGGTTWTATSVEIASPLVVACKPDAPDNVVVGVTGSLLRSTTGGGSGQWTSVLNVPNLTPLRLSVSSITTGDMYLGRQYVSGSKSFYSSVDGGLSWAVQLGFGYATSVYDVAPYPKTGSSRDTHVWAVGSDGTGEGTDPQVQASTRGVWWSIDKGVNWNQKNMGSFNVRALGIRDQGAGSNPKLIAGTASGKLFRSTNNGDNWSQLTNLTGVTSITGIRVRTDNNQIYVATNNGVYLSADDGTSWTGPVGTGMSDKNILSLAVVPNSQTTMYAATPTTVYKTTDGGSTWNPVDNGLGRMPLSSVVSNGSNVWSVSKNYSVAGKYDGTQWTNVIIGNGTEVFSGERIIRHSNGNLFGSGATDGKATLYRSTDGGSSYPNKYQPSTYTGTNFYGMIVDPANSSYMYLFGFAKASDGVVRNWLRSIDAGVTWDATLPQIVSATTTVQDIAIDPTGAAGSSQALFAAIQNGGIQKSTNGGLSWSQVFFSPTIDVKSIALNSSLPSVVYAATSTGIWKSPSSGVSGSWMNIKGGAFKKVIMNPSFPNSTNYVWAIANDGSKAYYTADGGSSWIDGTGGLPTPINDLRGESGVAYAASDNGSYKIIIPSAATLSSPTPGASIGMVPTLTWTAVSGATSYHLQVATDINFTNIISDQPSLTTPSYAPTNLSATTYYWKVAAGNLASEVFSGSQSFSTSSQGTIGLTITYIVGTDGVVHPRLVITPSGQYSALYIYRYSCAYPAPWTCSSWPYPFLASVATETPQTTYDDYGVVPAAKGQTITTTYYYQVRSAGISTTPNPGVNTANQQKIGIS